MKADSGLLEIYERLLTAYGPQKWWPAETPFEMMVGAVLTQNTSWTNVERAIAALRSRGLLDPAQIVGCDEASLAETIRPSGYFNQKAHRLKLLADFYLEQSSLAGLKRLPQPRHALLTLHGIGPETADSILLYALGMPVFVIDAYTRRIFTRLGLIPPDTTYHTLQALFEANLPAEVPLYREYHALIVMHAKAHCRSRPACDDCPLSGDCPVAHQAASLRSR
ncbi:MAG TPA: endonuclease III domain-containing protein [Mariprofundaceae bacterium]|nr:endonuclease III domain-containing protein [Mariprofundaceae bacterium]